jgi:hypothetical protein
MRREEFKEFEDRSQNPGVRRRWVGRRFRRGSASWFTKGVSKLVISSWIAGIEGFRLTLRIQITEY